MRGLLPNSVVIVLVSLCLTACGGATGTTATSGGTGTGTGTGSGGTVTPTLTISLVDVTGSPTSRISSTQPGTVVAQVTNLTSSAIVRYTTTLGQFNPSTGTALTNGSGQATIDIEAGSASGAGEISASATVDGSTVTSNVIAFEILPFNVVQAGVQIGTCSGGTGALDCTTGGTTFTPNAMYVADPVISARGTTTLGVVVVDSTGIPLKDVSVNFTSTCTNLFNGSQPEASISAGKSDVNGIVAVTYQASGCEGVDNITASEPSSGEESTGSLTVQPPIIGSIVFDAVEDSLGNTINTIFIQESGGENTARVIFQVLDRFGDPAEGQEVSFELTTTAGGLSLQTPTGLTDANGKATAFVNSGFIATTVRVRASLDVDTDNDGMTDTTLVTLSARLSVSTGIADQNSMSISTSTFNLEGEQFDGITASITVKLADAFNNPVPDGTSVQFRTEYGRVTPSCNTSGGDCTVTWNSQEPRRQLDPNAFVPLLDDGTCPAELIYEEPVTISGTDGDTQYVVDAVNRVETTADVALVEGVDYSVDSDGTGITCDGASATCVDTANLKITYHRLNPDEDDSGDTTHVISNPGVATTPYTANSFVPCLTGGRAATETEPAYFGGLGQLYGGRSAVLAFAQGEESFTDTNANGQYDYGEPFVDLPEAFLDVNGDGVFGNGNPSVDDSRDNATPTCYGPEAPLSGSNPPLKNCYQEGGDEDIFVDFDNDGVFDAGNGIYNGTLCPKAISDRTDTCNNNTSNRSTGLTPDPCDQATEQYCTRTLVNIRRTITILSAGSAAYMSLRDGSYGEHITSVNLTGNPAFGTLDASVDLTANDGTTILAGSDFTVGFGDSQVSPGIGESVSLRSGTGFVLVDISDAFNGRLPSGTSIGVDSTACAIDNSPGTSVVSSSSFGFTTIGIALNSQQNPITDSGTVTVSVTTPQGLISQLGFSCSY